MSSTLGGVVYVGLSACCYLSILQTSYQKAIKRKNKEMHLRDVGKEQQTEEFPPLSPSPDLD